MGLIGMKKAAELMGRTGPRAVDSARRTLVNAGIELHEASPRFYMVEEVDLKAFLKRKGIQTSPGRPKKAKD